MMIFAVTENGGLTMPKELCQDCETLFEPKSNKAFICPLCHRKRLSRYAKKRHLNKLGNEAYSKMCALRRADHDQA